MLQRSCFAQKRHLEWTSVRCKSSTYQPTFNPGRHIFSSIQPPSEPTVPSIGLKHSLADSYHQQNLKHSADEVSAFSIPHKLSPIIDALVTRQPQNLILQSIKQSVEILSLFSEREKMGKTVVALAKSSTPVRSLEVLKLAHHLGHTLPQSIYRSVCFYLAAAKQWDTLLDVVHTGVRDTGFTSARLLNWRAMALMKTRQYSRLQDILEDFKTANLSPNQQTYHIMLMACLQNNDMDGAKRCFQDMEQAGFTANGTTHAHIARYHRQFGPNTDIRLNALATLDQFSPKARVGVVNDLIQSALEARDIFSTLQLLTMFDTSSIQVFVKLLSPQVDGKRYEPVEALSSIPLHSLKPNGDTFAKFMNHHIRNSNFEGAIRLWKAGSSTGVPATLGVIISLVHALFLIGCGNSAIRMIAKISDQSTSHKFTPLMTGFDSGQDDPTLNLSYPTFTIQLCNALLRGLLHRQGLAPIPALFDIMFANNLKPNDQTLNLIMSHVNRTEEPLPESLFQLLQNLSPSIHPSLNHLHHLLSCIVRAEKRQFINSAWKRSDTSTIPRKKGRASAIRLLDTAKPFDPTAGLTFTQCAPCSHQARKMIKSLAVRGVKSDSPMIFSRIRRDAVLRLDIESAHDVFRTLVARGMPPNHYHFGALVEGYALSGNFVSANEVMAAAEQAGIKPNILMYTTLIAAHARHHDPTSAMRVFREMVSARIYPDVPSIDALVSAFYAVGDLEVARRLLISLWTSIQPFPDALNDATLPTLITHFRTLHPLRSKGKKTVLPRRYSTSNHVKSLSYTYQRIFGPYAKFIARGNFDINR